MRIKILLALVAAGMACAAPAAAQTHTKKQAYHRPVHKKTAQDELLDAQVAAGVAQLKALGAEAHPLDEQAQRNAMNSQADADHAQIASDRNLCGNRQALAVRMRNASLQDQNYLMSLCGRR